MIPKIIHQVWSEKTGPLPDFLKEWSQTWKTFNPDWKYEYWNNERMDAFIKDYFPEYTDIYYQFKYDIQRWDAIRYLILWKMGGMYVDFDYECLEPIEDLLCKECCFSMESHTNPEFKDIPHFNNALMACSQNNPFMLKIIEEVFSGKKCKYPESDKFYHVLASTGPLVLANTYDKYEHKEDVYLIPAELVSPFNIEEIRLIMSGYTNEFFENKLQKAKAIHYFLGNWKK